MNPDGSKLFRERLRSLREAKGLSQSQLEERIGKEANYITRIETGRIESPPLDVISSIAEGLGVLMSDLFSFEGLDDSANELRAKIYCLIDTDDPAVLRKYYRLLLVAQEK
jgi:transcriptional regulator with XRE-family HTH domain